MSAACYVVGLVVGRSLAGEAADPIVVEEDPIGFGKDPIADLEADIVVEGIERRRIEGLEHLCTATAGLNSFEEALGRGNLVDCSVLSVGCCIFVRIP